MFICFKKCFKKILVSLFDEMEFYAKTKIQVPDTIVFTIIC